MKTETRFSEFAAHRGSYSPLKCWVWPHGKTSAGYGQFRKNGKLVYVHRAMYELVRGQIPSGHQIDHLCKNTSCCNPAHLEAVSCRINIIRSDSRGGINFMKTECLRGHAFSPENTRSNSRGWRKCLTCERLRGPSMPSAKYTPPKVCGAGHAMTEENCLTNKRGFVSCRECNRARSARTNARIRAAKHAASHSPE